MTGPWNTPGRLIVLSLVLVCSLVAGASSVWHAAGDPVIQEATTWSPGTTDPRLTGLPPQLSTGREPLAPARSGARQGDAAHLALLPPPHGSAAVGDPQQFGHRPAGSRSPPPA
ncbi:hypothetical protein E1267_30235 [Nonomuraea longispora]|uniref:Uncharacterized protein n=1 Tax=Nonomuraea longispora TaxID=1848320 RepID=A0A4R4N4I2_9ACTN|nr:hypothetical protein [Nonomuraea longispora]TDC02043.1 hypothetical protein E1267_30235 [Nonomuraea longispora]